MTSLLPHFGWLLHPSQMNVQKAHQRRQLNVQWTTRGRAGHSLTMCQLTRDNAQGRLMRWTSNKLKTVLLLNSWVSATLKKSEQVGNHASTQLVGSCHDKTSERAGCIASTQHDFTFQLIVGFIQHHQSSTRKSRQCQSFVDSVDRLVAMPNGRHKWDKQLEAMTITCQQDDCCVISNRVKWIWRPPWAHWPHQRPCRSMTPKPTPKPTTIFPVYSNLEYTGNIMQ